MGHKHSVYDTDSHFAIDPVTRRITNHSSSKITLIQFDHNSERFTFQLPRYIEEHDMSLCNKVEVHYINEQNADIYIVDDLQVSPDDEEVVIFSWLLSRNATSFVGALDFMIRFSCLTDDVVDYAWNTGTFTGISISSGINNTDALEEEYSDTLETWKKEFDTLLDGKSAYEVALENGFEGTEEEWLQSLKGEKGEQGEPGADGTVSFSYLTPSQKESLRGERGHGIISVAKVSSVGLVDTYEIYFTDGTSTTFEITNGADGKDGETVNAERFAQMDAKLNEFEDEVDKCTTVTSNCLNNTYKNSDDIEALDTRLTDLENNTNEAVAKVDQTGIVAYSNTYGEDTTHTISAPPVPSTIAMRSSSGEIYVANATGNSSAVPLSQMKQYVNTQLSQSREALYRHDIIIGEENNTITQIHFTVINSDPTDYSAERVFDEVSFEVITPLTADHFAFLPTTPISATGFFDGSGDASAEEIVFSIYRGDGEILLGTINLANTSCDERTISYYDIGYIRDTVNAMGGLIPNGDGVSY